MTSFGRSGLRWCLRETDCSPRCLYLKVMAQAISLRAKFYQLMDLEANRGVGETMMPPGLLIAAQSPFAPLPEAILKMSSLAPLLRRRLRWNAYGSTEPFGEMVLWTTLPFCHAFPQKSAAKKEAHLAFVLGMQIGAHVVQCVAPALGQRQKINIGRISFQWLPGVLPITLFHCGQRSLHRGF